MGQPFKATKKGRRLTGLTLMEVVVATGLIAVISLFAIGVIVRLLNIGGKTAYQTAAALLAEEYLDKSAAAGPPYWGFTGTEQQNWTGYRNLILPGEDSTARFNYKVSVLKLRKSSDDLGTLSQVTATVWWAGDEPGVQAGLGKTSVTATRTVYARGEVDLNL